MEEEQLSCLKEYDFETAKQQAVTSALGTALPEVFEPAPQVQVEVADAELWVRDEKIAMLERRVRSLKKMARNRKLGKFCVK